MKATRLAVKRWCSSPAGLPDALPNFGRAEFEDTCKRRFVFGLGFDCYGGVGGLYDFGPVGCAIKNNFLNQWRQHFILEENMLEIDTSCITPSEVFRTSGHEERFTDVMVKDMVTGELLRVDKYLEDWTDKKLADKKAKLTEEQREELKMLHRMADGMSVDQFKHELAKWEVKSPAGNALSEPEHFNLMFPTPIGPAGDRRGYLRPELAQGIMLNFNRMLEFNGGRMPFAGAAIGMAFRNEIAPRNNLLRVREFTLAEIEHFVNPNDKNHPKFASVADLKLWMWTKDMQEAGKEPEQVVLGEAVAAGTVDNQTLGYFIGRAFMFAQSVGLRFLRFRQHRSNEMAHYAQDCWDMECLSSFGWVECIGIADRSCYDLTCHGKERKTKFEAYEKFKEPQTVQQLERKVDKGAISKVFKRDSAKVLEYLNELNEEAALALEAQLAAASPVEVAVSEELKVSLERKMVSFAKVEKKLEGRNYTPSVIEPSFGIGRLIYTLLEQVYWVRRDEKVEVEEADAPADGKKKKKAAAKDDKNEKRAVFSLPAKICPYKCTVMPLTPTVFRATFCQDLIVELRKLLAPLGISYKVDDGSQAIGKKYARSDEIGVPYGLTIDQDTETTQKVTLRERDSMRQVYLTVAEVPQVLDALCTDRLTWDEVMQKYPVKKN
eukprot:TRINITY_DN2641_c0_g3_i6.p1 TRINITY_DN2641_c0_g3~~TRINITY_DN2641_c0_g3_i6.p1  ORF type:complete len:683 (+),score=382.61 TRINITY_DN2641_c0_g3_i6:62-2050(+)